MARPNNYPHLPSPFNTPAMDHPWSFPLPYESHQQIVVEDEVLNIKKGKKHIWKCGD